MKLLRSHTFRLALYYAGLFSLSVALLGALYYVTAIKWPLDRVREGLEVEAERFSELHGEQGLTALAVALERRAAEPNPRLGYHALLDRSGRTVSANLPSWPRKIEDEWLRIEADVAQEGDEDEHEALVNDRALSDGSRLLIGRDIDDLDEVEEAVTDTLAWLVPAILLLSVGGGALMSRAIGRRIENVATAARAVIAGDLTERVPLRGTGDEFDRLGETLNLMLERIEQGMDGVRRVSDSVAHELRTPLTRLRASLAELERSSDEEAVADAVHEAERLDTIFNAVLRISRIEAAQPGAARARVDLGAIIHDAVELYQPEAEARRQILDVDVAPDLWVEADRDLLFQAITNLLDNAVKFSPEGGRIAVHAAPKNDRVHLRIADQGPGIAPEFRARITERFFRAPLANGVPGVGLGLALVSAVASFHEAPIRFDGAGPGLKVEWDFARYGQRAADRT